MGTAVEQAQIEGQQVAHAGRAGKGKAATATGLNASVAVATLTAALGKVSGTAARGNSLPVLSHVKLEAVEQTGQARGGALTLTATDLDQTVRVTIEADVASAGVVLVPSKTFAELVKELRGTVTLAADERSVKVTSGRTRAKLHGIDAAEFPSAMTTGEATTTVMLPMAALLAGIGHVAFAVSTEESRPILGGVLWELSPDAIGMVATNGHRLARWTKAAAGSPTPAHLIVPPAALESMKKLFHAEEEVLVEASGLALTVSGESGAVTTRLIEGPYPNYQQVIPTDNPIRATLDRKELLTLLRRVSILSSDQTHRVVLRFTPDALTVESMTPDEGEATDTMGVTDYEGEPLTIGFNAEYLLQMLKVIATAEVVLEMKAPERAVLIHAAGPEAEGETYRQLVMPLRIVD